MRLGGMHKLLILAALAFPSPALAAQGLQSRPATHREVQYAKRVAIRYWLAQGFSGPTCQPRVRWAHLAAFAAQADLSGCTITFAAGDYYWPVRTRVGIAAGSDSGWPAFCTALAHEWGHLILGPTFFAASNPDDPAHSPDPRNLMYAEQVHYLPACERSHP